MRINIRDNKNMPIGWLDDTGSEIKAFHLRKGYVGRYSKASDITFTSSGQVFCYGDGAQCLIREKDK